MKRLNLILLLSAVTVALAFVISCKETNTGQLERMRGDWVSTGSKPPFTLSEENGQYRVTVIKKSHAGNTRTETYLNTGNGRLPLYRNGAGGDADLR